MDKYCNFSSQGLQVDAWAVVGLKTVSTADAGQRQQLFLIILPKFGRIVESEASHVSTAVTFWTSSQALLHLHYIWKHPTVMLEGYTVILAVELFQYWTEDYVKDQMDDAQREKLVHFTERRHSSHTKIKRSDDGGQAHCKFVTRKHFIKLTCSFSTV